MTANLIYPCGRVSRRAFLHQAGGGFLGAAMGALWAEDGKIPDARLGPHFAPRAKSVIFLFMCGGVSHIDTFDPKDNKWAGKLIDAVGFGDNVAEMKRPVIPCLRTFTRYGKSGIPVSDWFPHVGSVIDDIAVVRSMWCHEGNHFPAVIETSTGHRGRQFDHPAFGSWVVVCARNGQQESPDFREHRPPVFAGAIDRRVSRRERGRDPVPGGRNADSEPVPAQRGKRRGAGAPDADAARAEPGIPRTLRHQFRYRGARQGLRAGCADAAVRPGGSRFFQRAEAGAWTFTASAKRKPTISAGSFCSRAAWRNRAFDSSRSAMPGAAMARGTRTAT